MAFQKTVNTYPGIGIPGAYAAINPIVSTAKGYVASDSSTEGDRLLRYIADLIVQRFL